MRHVDKVIALAALAGLTAPAAAEEARWNAHVEIGPAIVVDQPVGATTEQQLRRAGMHLRLAGEFEPHERFGIEVAYGLDLMFLEYRASTNAQQSLVAGARFRPWYNRETGFLVPKKERKIGFITDVLSDFWVDVHVGGSFADRSRFMYDVGIGSRVPVVWPLQVGLYVRWQHLLDFGELSSSYMLITFGATFSLGFGPVHGTPDEDHDGVADDKDRCPGTGRDATINEVGCPVSPEAPRRTSGPPPCSDTDLDGVCDGSDECPETRLGSKVDKKGCPPEANAPDETELPPAKDPPKQE